jgi:hypothetical protein
MLLLVLGARWRSYRYYDRYSSFHLSHDDSRIRSIQHVIVTMPGKLAIYGTLQEVSQPVEVVKQGYWVEQQREEPPLLTAQPVDSDRREMSLFHQPFIRTWGVEFGGRSQVAGTFKSDPDRSVRERMVIIPFAELAEVIAVLPTLIVLWALWSHRRDRPMAWLKSAWNELITVIVTIIFIGFVAGVYLWASGWRNIYSVTWLVQAGGESGKRIYSERALYLNRGWAYGGIATIPPRSRSFWENLQAITYDAQPSAGNFAPEVEIPMSNSAALMSGFRIYVPPPNGPIPTAKGNGTIDRGILVPPWACIAGICVAGLLRPGVFARRIWLWRRLRYRIRHGLCLACGYDLRGLDGRCPECGRVRSGTV